MESTKCQLPLGKKIISVLNCDFIEKEISNTYYIHIHHSWDLCCCFFFFGSRKVLKTCFDFQCCQRWGDGFVLFGIVSTYCSFLTSYINYSPSMIANICHNKHLVQNWKIQLLCVFQPMPGFFRVGCML